MKRIIVFLVCVLFLAIPRAGEAHDVLGTVPIAMFGGSTDFSLLNSWFVENSYGQASLEFNQFPGENVTYPWENTMSAVNAHPGYYAYIFYNPSQSYNATYYWYGGTPYTGMYQHPAVILVNTLSVYTIGHELAHAFGLTHPEYYYCPDDLFDVNCIARADGWSMAQGPWPAANREILGWLETLEITQSGTYDLSPVEEPVGPRSYSFDVTDPWTMTSHKMYIEHRFGRLEFNYRDNYIRTPDGTTVMYYLVGFSGNGYCFDTPTGQIQIDSIYPYTSFTVSMDCTVPEPPVCEPLPTEYRIVSCIPPYRGTMTQQRTSTCPGPTWGTWTTISNTCQKKGKK